MSTFNKYRVKGAYHYDWYETEDWYKYLVDRCVKFCKNGTVDVGGGDGVVASKILDKYDLALVLDNDPEAGKLCLDRKIPFELVDLDSWPWDISVDKVNYLACLNAIEHMNHPEYLREFIRDNVKKGAIITTIDYQGGALGEDHKFEWTYEQMMDFFKEFNPKGFRYKDTEWIGVEITK